MPDGMSFIMRPVGAGMARLEEMQDGTYDLADVLLMNDWLSVEGENRKRAQKAAAETK